MSDVDDGEEVVSHRLYINLKGEVYPEKCITVLITSNEDKWKMQRWIQDRVWLAEGIVAQIQPISNYDNDDEIKGDPY